MNQKLMLNTEYLPKNDTIFSIMFSDKTLFAALFAALIGESIEPTEVLSQASIVSENIDQQGIRLDTYGMDSNGRSFSADMQNKYFRKYVANRTIFYASKLISRQTVTDYKYEELKQVAVSFILTSKEKSPPVEIVRMYNQNNELYSDLITLYNVYVPTAIHAADNEVDPVVKMFSIFFAITTQEELDRFSETYREDPLANLILRKYGEAINHPHLDEIARKEYFQMKSYEQLHMELLEEKENMKAEAEQVKAEAEQVKAEAEQVKAEKAQLVAQQIAIAEALYAAGKTPEQIAEIMRVTVDKVYVLLRSDNPPEN